MSRAKVIILVTLWLAVGHAFDTCDVVYFCSSLRNRGQQDLYTGDGSTLNINDNNVATLTLRANDGSGDLTLTVSGLADNTFRVKIKEVDSNRFELQDALDGDPELQQFEVANSDDNGLTLQLAGANSARISFAPFNIEFSKNGGVVAVINGNRLILEHNDNSQAFAFAVSFPQAFQTYGLHEHGERLALQNTAQVGIDPYRFNNVDYGWYALGSPQALYGTVPFVYGHGPDATAGAFFHNAAEQWIDISKTGDVGTQVYFMAESATLDVFIFLGPSPVEVNRQYVRLTGTAYVPQLWTLGYHQCRFSYGTQDLVLEVVANMDNANFQMDAIWLDIDYTNGKRYFTWNTDAFYDPVGMQNTIASTNRKLVAIIDPHIKVEQGYNVYDNCEGNGYFVKNQDGSDFQGDCWPGLSSWVDFLNPDARSFIASMYSYNNFPMTTSTLAGIWNDMNEPSIFNGGIEGTFPASSIHYGGVAHRDIHNMYGFLHTKSTNQGLMERDNGATRPFILTRSTFAGSQRYAAFWTGDNAADWPYLQYAVIMCLNANINGLVFCGADVGGFVGNPTTELFERWYQGGAWLPFYRAHSEGGANRREPYLYPDDVQVVFRNAMQQRYQHLPTWYTLFYEHTVIGDPVIRPLFYHYPQDTNVYTIDDHILVGRDILVRPVVEPGVQSVELYFPGGNDEMWVSIDGNDVRRGNGGVEIPVTIDSIPVYYRKGAVIVRKDTVRRSSAEMTNDGHTLYVIPDYDGSARGTAFLDDHTSFAYRDNNDFNYVQIDMAMTSMTVTKMNKADGADDFPFVVDQVIYYNITRMPENGDSGNCEKVVIDRDSNGVLLKDMKLGTSDKVTVHF